MEVGVYFVEKMEEASEDGVEERILELVVYDLGLC